MSFRTRTGVTQVLLALSCLSAGTLSAHGGSCTDTPIVWTLYNSYTDPSTGLVLTSAIAGDGVQTDSGGNTVYSPGKAVNSVIFDCKNTGTPSFDAVLDGFRGRSFHVNLGTALGNDYQKFPPASVFSGSLLNVSDIQWCQNHSMPNGCTFYTRLTTALSATDGNTYHFRMKNPNSVPVTSWSPDSTANCPYTNSPVQVVFTPGALSPSGKDTYVVTPVLQGTNTGSGFTAPPVNAGCPATSLPAGTWPAGVGVLIQGTTGNSFNFGQYDVPFKFVIQNQ